MKPKPIAVCCGDLHLSLLKPACRADDDWLAVQAGYLDQLKDIAGNLPILCAGDIFDRWNTPPELVNFALQHLPDNMLCVPGQHDLMSHRIDFMGKCGYGVLKQAKKIVDLSDGPYDSGVFIAYGFGWDMHITPLENRRGGRIHIAVIHKYVWMLNHKYPDAPKESNLGSFKNVLRTYDAVAIGDNHIHWAAEI